jgi:hypothetical protein
MLTLRTTQLPTPITMQRDLDKTARTCYRINDEPFESEEFGKTFDFHDATLENGNNGSFILNHCTSHCCVVYHSKIIRHVAVEPVFSPHRNRVRRWFAWLSPIDCR